MNRRKFLATLLAGSAAVILPIEIVNSATNKLLDWHKDNANILADIKAACEQIERNSNMIPDIICMGHETYKRFMEAVEKDGKRGPPPLAGMISEWKAFKDKGWII